MKKRLLTILLALALAVSMIPTCFAYYTASDTRPTPSQPWYGIVKVEGGCKIRQPWHEPPCHRRYGHVARAAGGDGVYAR